MRADRRFLYSTLGILVLALGFAPLRASEIGSFRGGLSSITAEESGRHVDVLADDTFEGREAGSRGGLAAGGYLVEFLRANGISPAGEDGGYYQSFDRGFRNVLAIIPGRDAELRDEYVVLGAHYDHVGYGQSHNSLGPTGRIHHGADDNASGTSGLMEVIQAFTMLPQPPRRSLLFAFWDGEEQGLLGSKHWIAHPTVPLEHIRMTFNLDMIGRLRDNRLEIYGARQAPAIWHVDQPPQLGLRPGAGFPLGSGAQRRSLPVFRAWHSVSDAPHRVARPIPSAHGQGASDQRGGGPIGGTTHVLSGP